MAIEEQKAAQIEQVDNNNENLTGSGYLKLLRTNRNYRRLWLAQVVSLLGDWFNLVAGVALVSHYTGAAQALAGLFIVRLAPMFLLGPFAGVLADRFNRRTLMIVADLSRALTVLGFLFIHSAADLWLIYILTLVQFSLGTLFEPARSALIPAITALEERVAANALGALTWSTMVAVGSALGGLTTGLVGTDVAFTVDALSFVGSALMVAGIPGKVAASCNGNCGKIQMGADLKAGFGYLKTRPAIFAYTLIKPLGALSDGALFSIIALQATHTYPLGQDGSFSLGLLNLAIGVGTGVGPWLGARLLRRMGENRSNLQKLISYCYILFGLGYGLFCNTNLLPLAVLAMIVGEIGGGSRWVFSTTLLQLSTQENFRGRVFAVEMALMNLANIIAALLGAFLLDQLRIPIPVAGLGLAALQITIGLVWWLVSSRLARHAKTRQEAQTSAQEELLAA